MNDKLCVVMYIIKNHKMKPEVAHVDGPISYHRAAFRAHLSRLLYPGGCFWIAEPSDEIRKELSNETIPLA